jgi:hypothetical protein
VQLQAKQVGYWDELSNLKLAVVAPANGNQPEQPFFLPK